MKRAGASVLAVMSSLALAQSDSTMQSDRFAIYLSALYLWDTEMDVSARSAGTPLGATVNFERDLNLEESVTIPRLGGYFRISPHHRVDFSWYQLERSGVRFIDREFSFDDETYPVGADVSSEIKNELGQLSYTWSFHHTDEVEIGLSLGVYVIRYQVELVERTRPLITRESVSTPLPLIGLSVDYTISNRWHALFEFKTFSLEVDADTRGALDELQVTLEYRSTGKWFLGVGLNRFSLNLKLNNNHRAWTVSGLNNGVQAYVGFRY